MVSIKVPRVLTVVIRSNFFVDILRVGLRSMADALLTNISIFPNVSAIIFTAFCTSYYFLKSQAIAMTLPLPPISYTYF